MLPSTGSGGHLAPLRLRSLRSHDRVAPGVAEVALDDAPLEEGGVHAAGGVDRGEPRRVVGGGGGSGGGEEDSHGPLARWV